MEKKRKESLQDIAEYIQPLNPEFSVDELEKILRAAFNEIALGVVCGDRVEMRGFISMVVRKREQRLARNPRTNKRVQVSDKGSLYVRASRELISALNA